MLQARCMILVQQKFPYGWIYFVKLYFNCLIPLVFFYFFMSCIPLGLYEICIRLFIGIQLSFINFYFGGNYLSGHYFIFSVSLIENRDDGASNLIWSRGGTREQGLQSLNFPSVNMFPWMQQRADASMIRSDLSQQYNAMLASGFPNVESGDTSKQHTGHIQQPFQFIQQASSQNQQLQLLQQKIPHDIVPSHSQFSTAMSQHLFSQQFNSHTEEENQQQQHTYLNTMKIPSEQLDQKRPMLESTTQFLPSVTPRENILGSLCSEGSGNFFSLLKAGHSALSEHLPQQSWDHPKFADPPVNDFSISMSLPPYPGKDITSEPDNCISNSQNCTQFGVNRESSGLVLPTTLSSFATHSNDVEASTMPLDDSGNQNLYGYMGDSLELLPSTGQVDPPTSARTFVKV